MLIGQTLDYLRFIEGPAVGSRPVRLRSSVRLPAVAQSLSLQPLASWFLFAQDPTASFS
eukprot:COSAG01_NODE_325_length_18790_cov_64.371101_20_plen_59_part_00